MSSREMGDRGPSDDAPSPPTPRIYLLFRERIELDLQELAEGLAAFDPALVDAVISMEVETQITEVKFGDHVVRLRAIGEPLPDAAVEACLQLAHFDVVEKERARAHVCFIILEHANAELSPLERYQALAILASAFARLGIDPRSTVGVDAAAEGSTGSWILNFAARTAVPSGALICPSSELIGLVETLSPLLFYMGFAKYQLPDGEGGPAVWMRTHGGEIFGVPDLARLAASHDEGLATFQTLSELSTHMIQTRAVFSEGDVLQVPGLGGPDDLVVLRAPVEAEPFLLDGWPVLVLQPAVRAEESPREEADR